MKTPTETTALRYLGAIIVTATLARLSLGLFYFGFHTGDDVEILQAGFMRALGRPYQPWDIRNLLVSDLLVTPFLALASAFGVDSTRQLVWIASFPFVILGSFNIWAVHRLTLEWLARVEPALLAAGLYASHWLPLGYGSTVYPRTASTACVLLGAVLLCGKGSEVWKSLLAGALVAIAWAIRYSEAVFVLPLLAIVYFKEVTFNRRIRHWELCSPGLRP